MHLATLRLEKIDVPVTQHSLPNDELCHDTSDSESEPKNGQVQLRRSLPLSDVCTLRRDMGAGRRGAAHRLRVRLSGRLASADSGRR